MEVLFRTGQISKITKIQALGSKCDPSLQDGLPGTQNTQKSWKNEGRDYLFFKKILSSYDPRIKFHEMKMRRGGGLGAQRTGIILYYAILYNIIS